MNWLEAVILGLVEGLTEFVPVSSTGHLVLAAAAMGLEGKAIGPYLVVIQFGAILAVAWYYHERVAALCRGVVGRDAGGRRLAGMLMAGFLPGVGMGLMLEGGISRLLDSTLGVAAALAVGGVVMIVVERIPDRIVRVRSLDDLTLTDALVVGFAQCFSLWPGMSRSMCAMVAGLVRGLDERTSADFAFLLGLPTLGAASLYQLVDNWDALAGMEGGFVTLAVGLAAAFVSGWAAVAWFLRILQKVGLTPFGIYRILLAAVIIGLMATKGL